MKFLINFCFAFMIVISIKYFLNVLKNTVL